MLLAGNDIQKAKQIIGRIPCYGMAKDTSSGSFDSTSLPLRGREVPLRMTGIKFLDLTLEIKLYHYLSSEPVTLPSTCWL